MSGRRSDDASEIWTIPDRSVLERRVIARRCLTARTARRVLLARQVVTLEHEILVEMFRQRPALARELLRRSFSIDLDGTAELATTDLSQALPTEYRADVVTVLKNAEGVTTAAVIVEVQRKRDAGKAWTWPVYVASLRARLRAPVLLLVMAPYAWVARWARGAIELGHPGFALRPIVISYAEVPRITDATIARAVPELAVLSAMAHPDLEVAAAATHAIFELTDEPSKLYLDLVLAALPEAIRAMLEVKVIKNYEYKSEFARRYVRQGRAEGREEGRNEGRKEGRQEAARDAVLAIAGVRLGGLTKVDVERIAVLDLATAERILIELGRTTTVDEARVVLDGAVATAPDETGDETGDEIGDETGAETGDETSE